MNFSKYYLFLSILLATMLSACTDDEPATPPVVEEDNYEKEGFFITSVATTSAGTNMFGGYFKEMPTGDIDLTEYSTYLNFQVRARLGNFFYGSPINNSNGLSKYGINKTTGKLEEMGNIPNLDFVSSTVIINEDLGFYASTDSKDLFTFNPTTMQKTGKVDMSKGKTFPNNEINGLTAMVHNPITGKLLIPLYTDLDATPQFYDADEIYIEVIDVATQQWEKTIVHDEAEYAVFRGNQNPVIDEEGNTYFLAQGTYGLDNQIGPKAAKGSRPQVIKVNTKTEFEADYAFNPINELGFENNFFQMISSMVYGADGKAYGIATAAGESPELLALLAKLAAGTITEAEMGQLRNQVFNEAGQKLVEIDLENKKVKFVEGLPFTAGFAYPFLFNYGGKVYADYFSPGDSFNGYYEIDPKTGATKRLYNITGGGISHQLIDLSQEGDL